MESAAASVLIPHGAKVLGEWPTIHTLMVPREICAVLSRAASLKNARTPAFALSPLRASLMTSVSTRYTLSLVDQPDPGRNPGPSQHSVWLRVPLRGDGGVGRGAPRAISRGAPARHCDCVWLRAALARSPNLLADFEPSIGSCHSLPISYDSNASAGHVGLQAMLALPSREHHTCWSTDGMIAASTGSRPVR